MADIADMADDYQQLRLDAAIKTSNNFSKQLNIEGNGFCLDCGMSVEREECKIRNSDGAWEVRLIYPRWCCPECREMWGRDN